MNEFRKIIIVVTAIALLVMGGTAVFAQRAELASRSSAQQVDDGTLDEQLPPAEDGEQQDEGGERQGPRGHHNGDENGRLLDREAIGEAIAEALGITVEELKAAHDEGTKLPDLAESLGVDMEVVEAAIEAARAEAIAQAVADGTITQEQADEMAERAELKNIIRDIFDRDEMAAITADILGLTVEELEAAREEGIRLPELAEEAGVEMSVLADAIEQARADALQAAVDDGIITQEQADEIGSHPGSGKHGPRHGGKGGPGGRDGQGGRPNRGGQQGGGQGERQNSFNTAPAGTDA